MADDGDGGAAPPQFVSVFHNSEADDDGGVATPVGFQDTPDQWYSVRQKKRGAGSTLADAPTQVDDEATQPQSMATQVQSFVDHGVGAKSGFGPSFVNATGSFSSDGSGFDRRDDDVDEDETQIMMSLSQDREALRAAARRIEEEEVASVVEEKHAPQELMPHEGDASGNDSDLSDDMLEQDGDANGLAVIAKNFQLSESNESLAASLKKAPVNVYKPRGPFQITPPASVVGGDSVDESSGAETEVDEEPETTQVIGSTATENPLSAGVPPRALSISIRGQSPLRVGKRSASENNIVQTEEKRPRKSSLDRSASCEDIHSPERSRRSRVPLGKVMDGKPPLSRPSRLRLGSDDKPAEASSAPLPEAMSTISSSTANTVEDKGVVEQNVAPDIPMTEETREQDVEEGSDTTEAFPVATPVTPKKAAITPKKTAAPANRKRKLSAQVSDDNEVDASAAMDSLKSQPPPSQSQSQSRTSSNPSVRIMFTGLDGTIAKLRAKVKKIVDACQEDDDIEQVTHLIAPKNQLKRTVKLLCGISCCDHILDERWLDESARSGFCASESMHCLKDTAAEAKWNFSLYHTMYEVPKEKRRELFRGLRFFITNHKSVLPPVKDLVKIVECAGGQAETKGSADADHIVITSEAALALTGTKKALVHADPNRINSSELILSSILQQKVDLEAHRLVVSGEAETPSKKRARK